MSDKNTIAFQLLRAVNQQEIELAEERAAHLATRQELSMALAERAYARAEVERLNASAARGWQMADALHVSVREHRAEVERLRLVLEEMTQCGCETCHAQARAALAGSPVETRLPVDDEAEARFEKLLAKRREKAEAWLNQGPEVSGTLAFHAEPVETRRALAERVREACAEADDFNADAADGLRCAIRALDLDALLEKS